LDSAASLQVQDILFEQASSTCARNIPPDDDVAVKNKSYGVALTYASFVQMFGNQRIEFDEFLDFRPKISRERGFCFRQD